MSSNSKSFYGSICLTDLNEQAKAGHSGFSRAESNGKIYAEITVWDNGEVDKYGNQLGIQLKSKQDKQVEEGKIYIGNAKPNKKKEVAPLDAEAAAAEIPNDDDLPF